MVLNKPSGVITRNQQKDSKKATKLYDRNSTGKHNSTIDTSCNYTSQDGAVGGNSGNDNRKSTRGIKNTKEPDCDSKMMLPKMAKKKSNTSGISHITTSADVMNVIGIKNPTMTDILKFCEDIHKSQMYISQKYDDVLAKNEAISKENSNLKGKLLQCENRLTKLNDELEKLTFSVKLSTETEKANNFIVHGLPVISPKDCVEVVKEIALNLDINISESDIINIQTIARKSSNNVDQVVIMKTITTRIYIEKKIKSYCLSTEIIWQLTW